MTAPRLQSSLQSNFTSEKSKWSLEIQQIQAGQNPDSGTKSQSLPMHHTDYFFSNTISVY
jgi:O-acetylhomoserine/O-acetylserine sulfhydrylase-like pyridoxal-dependent enzyme